jgi:hypothetical protein
MRSARDEGKGSVHDDSPEPGNIALVTRSAEGWNQLRKKRGMQETNTAVNVSPKRSTYQETSSRATRLEGRRMAAEGGALPSAGLNELVGCGLIMLSF